MIHEGDCLEILKTMEANSLDSLVTDPPAGISFMGKDWDSNKGGSKAWIAWMSQVMQECLRVLKPGAHGLVWTIPRTSHWTATALEDAGFEIRDVVTHLFGSGFPKSLDISKAIDKAAGAERAKGVPQLRPDGSFRTNTEKSDGTSFATGSNDKYSSLPATADAKLWQGFGTALKPASEHWILCRKPIEKGLTISANVLKWGCGGLNIDKSRIPANNGAWVNEESLCDSCVKRVAKNARQSTQETKESIATENADIKASEKIHGILPDAISSEAIGCSGETSKANTSTSLNTFTSGKSIPAKRNREDTYSTTLTKIDPITGLKTCSMCARPLTSNTTRITGQGRFPSNLVLSHNEDCAWDGANYECTPGCAVALLDAQSGPCKTGDIKAGTLQGFGKGSNTYGEGVVPREYKTDTASGASRFFYVAKASKRERNEGCEGLPEKEKPGVFDDDNYEWKHDHVRAKPSANHHPTVKPLKLMTYLIRMVTPPGGTCLDPFAGSGSTGVAAVSEGFQFVGIEQSKEYVQIANKRIYHALPEFKKQYAKGES